MPLKCRIYQYFSTTFPMPRFYNNQSRLFGVPILLVSHPSLHNTTAGHCCEIIHVRGKTYHYYTKQPLVPLLVATISLCIPVDQSVMHFPYILSFLLRHRCVNIQFDMCVNLSVWYFIKICEPGLQGWFCQYLFPVHRFKIYILDNGI